LLAKALQYALAQNIGAALTLFRKVDNSFRDKFVSLTEPVGKSEGYASHFECHAHDAHGLAIKAYERTAVRRLLHNAHRSIGVGTAGVSAGSFWSGAKASAMWLPCTGTMHLEPHIPTCFHEFVPGSCARFLFGKGNGTRKLISSWQNFP
jgi:hypothetical protein